MSDKKKIIVISLFLLLILSFKVYSQDELVSLKVRGADISDVLVMLTEQSGINLVPDETVQGKVTINLQNVEFQEALKTLTIAYGYKFDKISERVYMVSQEGFSKPPEVIYNNGLLTLHVLNSDVREVIKEIAKKTGKNIVISNSITGKISVDLVEVPLEVGLNIMLQANGFSLSKTDDIYRVIDTGNRASNNLAISVVDGNVSIDVQQADVAEILRTISRLSGVNMVLFGGVREVVDLKLDDVPIQEAIDTILTGTRFTYRVVDGVYLIGDKNINSPASSILTTNALIPLEYLQVDKVPPLLPNNFPSANVKIIKEQNALLVTGTQAQIKNLKEYINKIDTKIPQIVVDALVIELSNNKIKNPILKLGMNYNDEEETVLFDSVLGQLTYKSVLDLPDDFYLKVNSLVNQGVATVKARPNITTLNGQQAVIDVGTVQYYKVIKIDSEGNETTQYQSVNAGVTLDVTPWVSSSGEITLKLKPTVSNIGGAATEGPPQISRREVSTTVRVKDGQTIVIGGLIQDVGSNSNSRVPLLADIPIIGSFFKSENNNVNQTELVIYITPHVLKENQESVKKDMELMLDKVERLNVGK